MGISLKNIFCDNGMDIQWKWLEMKNMEYDKDYYYVMLNNDGIEFILKMKECL